jgi:hypothetical protein
MMTYRGYGRDAFDCDPVTGVKKGNKAHLKLRFPAVHIAFQVNVKLSCALKEAEGVTCVAFCTIVALFVIPAADE